MSAIVTAAPWSSLRSKSTRYYPSRVIFLRFSITTQITAAKQTRLVTHSFKKGKNAIYGPLELLTVFSATAGCNFLGKTRKTVKCTGQKESEKPTSLLTKTENQRLNSVRENPQTVEDLKTEKPQLSSAKTEKPNQTSAKSVKPKIPTHPTENITQFKRRLRDRGYEDNLLENTLSEIEFSKRNSTLQNQKQKTCKRIYFAVCYRISPICA